MKEITELEKDVKSSPELKSMFMEVAQFIFSRSQENLTRSMPWGDELNPNTKGKKSTIISDTGDLLQSGVPPYWQDDTTIVFKYDAPHAEGVEYGREPHMPKVNDIIKWAKRKLGKKGKEAISFSWAVAYSIKENGILPHPYIRPSIAEAEQKFKLLRISY